MKIAASIVLTATALVIASSCTPAGTTVDNGTGGGPGGPATGALVCVTGTTDCGGVCQDLSSDTLNCGSCGNLCPANLPFCSLSACVATCAVGQTTCGSSCVDPNSNSLHCGVCNNACLAGQSCSGGSCVGMPLGSGGAAGVGGTGVGVGVGGTGVVGTGGTGVVGTGGTGVVGTGGTGTGGTGVIGSGGSGTGGAVVNNGDNPPGYWTYGNWAGCAWTGTDDTDSGTTITPSDFTGHVLGDPYCASGTVGAHADYESVALLGFNLNEDAATADCSYDPTAATSAGPPEVTMTGTGIAANIVKQGSDTAFTFRVQIQGQNGATDPASRWCATITATQGKIFVPYEDFNTECWDTTGADATPYAGEPISAVVFLVPGDPTAIPYDFCVNGFAAGDSAEDAPDGTAEIGDQAGTVGFTTVSPDGDFDRQKITVAGEQYIIQNNNWGNPEGSDLILDYFNNSFTVVQGSGSSTGGGVPASFPSIYIGANGQTSGGVLATAGTDNLPKQISSISSIPTSFAWSGSTTSFNATYDIWFANSPPSGEYNDGIDGFIMVWVHDPSDAQPIGSSQGSFSLGGVNYDVWVGPRGEGPDGNNDAPVVSYVAQGDVASGSFDLKAFFDDAVANHGFSASAYLTDVFFGFEIWNGGSGGNLKVEEFSIDVQ